MKNPLLALAVLSLAANALAQSSTETAPPTPGLEALPLQPTSATQTITLSPEVLAPSSMPPTAKVQTRKLSAVDAARLAAAERWERTGAAEALVGAGGAVEYPYGYARPTMTCAPLHVCSIALAQMGVPIVVSRSGITEMGLDVAQRLGLCAIGRATNKRFLCFSGAHRLVFQPES